MPFKSHDHSSDSAWEPALETVWGSSGDRSKGDHLLSATGPARPLSSASSSDARSPAAAALPVPLPPCASGAATVAAEVGLGSIVEALGSPRRSAMEPNSAFSTAARWRSVGGGCLILGFPLGATPAAAAPLLSFRPKETSPLLPPLALPPHPRRSAPPLSFCPQP